MPNSDPNVIYGGDVPEHFSGGCRSLGGLIVKNLTLGGDKVVLIDGNSQKKITFNQLKDQTLQIAGSMWAWGIRKGDVIGIISENCFEYPAIIFASLYLGAILAPMSPFYTKREVEHSLGISNPKFVFVSNLVADKVITTIQSIKKCSTKNVIMINGVTRDDFSISLGDFLKKGKPDRKHKRLMDTIDMFHHVSFILNSSGTTGLSKGVQITHANVMSCWYATKDRMMDLSVEYGHQPCLINVGPWFHVMGMMVMLIVSLSTVAKLVYLPKFDFKKFLIAMEANKVDQAICVPPIMVSLAKSPIVDQYDLTSLKEIHSGAASMSKEVIEAVRKRFKADIVIAQGYGMSETTLGVLGQTEMKKPGSVGQALAGVYVKVIDENGKSLGPNKNGELCFKGIRIMKGYIGNDAATKDAIKDGWLHTGDVGYYDEDKQFYIVDRIKELIKYKGFQSAPAEIEAILLSNPKIKDVGVIGIPDEECGELPYAYVVKQPNVNLMEKDVIDFVASLASRPKHLHGGVKFIEEIPKNPSGKILRKDLREMYKKTHLNSKL